MDIYCINMATRTDRWRWMQSQFAALKLEARRIDAVIPADLTAEQRDAYCNPKRLRSIVEPLYCCGLSHRQVWEAIAAGNRPWALVLEDDAVLSRSLPKFLEAVDNGQPEFSLIRIEQFQRKPRRFGPVELRITQDFNLRRAYFRDAGTAGYVVSKRTAARLLNEKSFHREQIDAFLFNPHNPFGRSLGVLYTEPALCIQLDTQESQMPERATDINQSVAEHRRRKRAHPANRLIRQITRWVGYDRRRLISRMEQWWRGGVADRTITFRAD